MKEEKKNTFFANGLRFINAFLIVVQLEHFTWIVAQYRGRICCALNIDRACFFIFNRDPMFVNNICVFFIMKICRFRVWLISVCFLFSRIISKLIEIGQPIIIVLSTLEILFLCEMENWIFVLRKKKMN